MGKRGNLLSRALIFSQHGEGFPTGNWQNRIKNAEFSLMKGKVGVFLLRDYKASHLGFSIPK